MKILTAILLSLPVAYCLQITMVKDSLPPASVHQSRNNLVERSRKNIIETGFSERYFNEHFKLVEAFDKPGDMRVVWKFFLNDYEALITDAIGYYTENGKKIYVHSVKNTLGSTHDIVKIIPRRRAQALMKSCLGRYASEAVVFLKLSPGQQTSLYLTAYSISKSTEAEKQKTKEPPLRSQPGQQRAEDDIAAREETRKHPPIYIGYINLETGKCSNGEAIGTP